MKKAIKRRFNNEPITPQPNCKSNQSSSTSPEIFYTPTELPSLKRKICQTPRRIENIKRMKVKSLFARDVDYSSESEDALKHVESRGIGLAGVRELRDIDAKAKTNIIEQMNSVEAGFMKCTINKNTSTPIVPIRQHTIATTVTGRMTAAATTTATITTTTVRTTTTAAATTTMRSTTTVRAATTTKTMTAMATATSRYMNKPNLPPHLRPKTDDTVDVMREIINRPSKILPMTRAELKRGLRL